MLYWLIKQCLNEANKDVLLDEITEEVEILG